MSVPGALLVVDDNELNRDMLSRRLQRKGYDVTVAEHGRRALELIAERPFDLVLLDVMMPDLNGLEVLADLRKSHSASDLPVIMATARSRSEDVVEALNLGANDYVTKPLDFPVVLARVQTQLTLKRAVDQVRLLELELVERNRVLESANGRMARDLKAAARVQEALLPRGTPGVSGLECAWTFRPCDELAGDGLGIVRLDASRVGLYVLDVSGHGVASALLSVSIARVLTPPDDPASILMRPAADGDRPGPASPAEVLDRLNLLFPFDLATEKFFTMVYGVFDAATGEFRYASAGHPGPVHLPADGPPALLEGRGFPVGLAEESCQERSLVMRAGDRLLLYSDGVPEAADLDGRLFGNERLLGAVDRARDEPLSAGVAALRMDVERWCGDAGVQDDVSILAVEFSGAIDRSDVARRA
ncbi:PP2C family protein-serine/threonine phosphatase [Paludisphaera mucosa]|uniref:SpoIIE family protein phosphatase n=1 Tax=Paludisphaera mucosa TaxID=3030827 RepID=A0ABT6FJY5_9BACT|nr:SpoIIE family protein phosphatase [Paludisphaera mucosa]MDG3007690.1 SpoIIE family protein phosphatase [Paludisphaera mucosa]